MLETSSESFATPLLRALSCAMIADIALRIDDNSARETASPALSADLDLVTGPEPGPRGARGLDP